MALDIQTLKNGFLGQILLFVVTQRHFLSPFVTKVLTLAIE